MGEGNHIWKVQGVFFTGPPPKMSKYRKVKLGVSRTISVNADSPNLGFPYFNSVCKQARKPRSYASLKLRPSDLLTHSLTRVKSRATSVAKKPTCLCLPMDTFPRTSLLGRFGNIKKFNIQKAKRCCQIDIWRLFQEHYIIPYHKTMSNLNGLELIANLP